MKIDFKKELEQASKSMIMIHDPKLLIKLIARMIVRKLGVKHAGMLIYDPRKDTFILSVSRGATGIKIPSGYARFTHDNPIIKLFSNKEFQPLIYERNAFVTDDISRLEKGREMDQGNACDIREFLRKVSIQMEMFNSEACVPAYYRDKLLAVLLLGEKNDDTKFEQEELNFFAALVSDTAMAIRNAQLFEDLKIEAERNHDLFINIIMALGSTIEAKDKYTHGHTERVTHYSLAVAHQMEKNGSVTFPEKFFDNLYVAGLLHDIGKIGVPETILNKQGKLTDEEFDIMRQHIRCAGDIIQSLNLPQETMEGILYHHERYDGRGYLKGLKEEELPLAAAIMAVGDAFDAMISDRPYRKGLGKEIAIEEIKKYSGAQFHPLSAQAMVELYEKGEI